VEKGYKMKTQNIISEEANEKFSVAFFIFNLLHPE
jgi:hypothetical protein